MEEVSFKACAIAATLFLYGAVQGGGDSGDRPAKRARTAQHARGMDDDVVAFLRRPRGEAEKVVSKHVLDNGLTVLVKPDHSLPSVSVRMCYRVGSRDEAEGQRGMAHLIEHMIFKGSRLLSETDIPAVTQKLSGSCNAHTCQDTTTYEFDFPTQHWEHALPMLADSMCSATFKQELLDSELKVVCQELRADRDNTGELLIGGMLRTIFSENSYGHPILGYHKDLLAMTSKKLRRFYKKHYVPANAVLVVVGDVEPADVFAATQRHFGHITSHAAPPRSDCCYSGDMSNTNFTYFRDRKEAASFVQAYVVPGLKSGSNLSLHLLARIMGGGRLSRLHRKLVDKLKLVDEVTVLPYLLFDQGLLVVSFETDDLGEFEAVTEAVQEEFDELASKGTSAQELERVLRQECGAHARFLESNQEQAERIVTAYLTTGDENHPFTALQCPIEELAQEVQALAADYCVQPLMHSGFVLPLPKKHRALNKRRRAESEADEEEFFAKHERVAPVEEPDYAQTVVPLRIPRFNPPQAESFVLENGVKVFTHHNPRTPGVEVLLDLRADHCYEPHNRKGILRFVCNMLAEGTREHPGPRFMRLLEERGIGCAVGAGRVHMSLLRDDLKFALAALHQMLTRAKFSRPAMERVRERLLTSAVERRKDPMHVASRLARRHVYGSHPCGKSAGGTAATIRDFSRRELLDCYRNLVTPDGACIAVVGDIADYNIHGLLSRIMGAWQGPALPDLECPPLEQTSAQVVEKNIASDQVALCFAGLSVNRADPLYERLLLFDQVFGSGLLGSLNGQLFKLREKTGFFYSIDGSVIAGSGRYPGIAAVSALVAPGEAARASEAIRELIDSAAQDLTVEQLGEARNAIARAATGYFDSNAETADTFLHLEKNNLPTNYYARRVRRLARITVPEVQEAVSQVLGTDRMVEVRAGRIESASAKPTSEQDKVASLLQELLMRAGQ